MGRNLPNYSFSRYTISEIYLFSGPTRQRLLLYLFLVKFVLDFLFSISIFRRLPIRSVSPAALLWFLPVISFGLMGIVPAVGQYYYPHLFLSIIMLFSWFFSEYVFSGLTKNTYFIDFSKKYIFLQLLVMFAFLATGHINGLFEIIYFSLSLLWLWTFLLVLDLR